MVVRPALFPGQPCLQTSAQLLQAGHDISLGTHTQFFVLIPAPQQTFLLEDTQSPACVGMGLGGGCKFHDNFLTSQEQAEKEETKGG